MIKNKVFLKSIALMVLVVFFMTFGLPIKQIAFAIEGSKLIESQDRLYSSNRKNVESKTRIGSLSEDISKYYNEIKFSFENRDLKWLKESIKNTRKALKNIRKAVIDELNENEKVVKQLNAKKALEKNNKFKEEIESQLLNLEGLLESLDELSEGIKELKGNNIENIGEKIDEIGKLLIPEQPSNPLGSVLPHNRVEEPEIPSIGEGSTVLSVTSTENVEAETLPREPQPEDLMENVEVKFTEEIKALANTFNTPVKMYEYVRNNIDFEPYYGSRKGSEGTLSQMSGNDYDQASLLISILRYKGIPARYVRGTVDIDIKKVMSWTGANDPKVATKIIASSGIPITTIMSGGKIANVRMEHVWVEAYIPYDRYRGISAMYGQRIWVPLDPSFKEYETIEGLSNIDNLLNVNKDNFIDTIGEVDEETGEIIGFRSSNYNTLIREGSEKLENYIIENNLENKTITEIFGGKKIIPQNLGLLPLTLPYKVIDNINKFNVLPKELSDIVSFSIYGEDPFGLNFSGDKEFNVTYRSPELYNKKVTLSYQPATDEDMAIIDKYGDIFSVPAYLVEMVPVLKIDGEAVATGDAIGLGYRQQFEMAIKSTGQREEIIKNDVLAGSFYNVGFDYQVVSQEELDKISDNLKELQSDLSVDNVYEDESIGEILNYVSKAYFAEMDLLNKLLMQQMGVFSVRQLSEGITGYRANVSYMFMSPVELNEGGLYIDVDRNIHAVTSYDGDSEIEKSYMIASGMIASALEHSIWEQATGDEAVSSIKVLEVASKKGIPVYMLSSANYDEYKENLNLSTSVENDISNAVRSGKIVTVAAEEIELGNWSGAGYIIMDPDTGAAGYMISGGIAGGALTSYVDFVYLVNIGFSMWDFVESVILISSALTAGGVLGGVFVVLGVLSLAFSIYSYYESIQLMNAYKMGDLEAGEELKRNMWFNIGAVVLTFGLGKVIKPIASRVSKSRLLKEFGDEFIEGILRNMDEASDSFRDIERTVKNLKNSNITDDIIREYGEKLGKNGLDWLDSKKVFNFVDDELRKLSNLGDDLVSYSDEFLNAFKNSNGYQDDIINIVNTYSNDAAEIIGKYGDNGVRAIDNFENDAIEIINYYGKAGSDLLGQENLTLANESFRALSQADEVTPIYSDTFMKQLEDGFVKDIDYKLESSGVAGVTAEERLMNFNKLRVKPATELTNEEIEVVRYIRDAVESPNSTTLMQKVIKEADIAKYLNGEYTEIGGFVAKAEDVKMLNSMEEIYDSLRLDYGDLSAFTKDGECGIIRFRTEDVEKMKIPYDENVFGVETGLDHPILWPQTGNGFTSAENGIIIPEYEIGWPRAELIDGAELYRKTTTGEEILIGVYNKQLEKFIPVTGK